ncbi:MULTISPECIES: Fic family protein [Pseudooceanicola]|nr:MULTISPECIES: Fic family protein [Pseudooceanicola]
MQIWNSPAWPRFTHDPLATEDLLARVSARLGAIGGLQAALSAEERQEAFLRAVTGEAMASFAIEGASLPADQIEASVVASLAYRGAERPLLRRTDAIAELMLEARAGAAPLDGALLLRWHDLLFHGIEVEDRGRWRTFPMEIVRGATGRREDVLYVAPPPIRVAQEMTRFLDWLAQDRHPAPIRAALAHLWFESIHPFSDGNGRIGRAIIEHVFARSGAGAGEGALPFSLSRQIEADKRGYYAALQAGRRIVGDRLDATPFVCWLLERILAGVSLAEAEARFLVRRNAFFSRHADLPVRADRVLRRLFAEGEERLAQGLSAGPYGRIAGVSAATATRDLADLERRGVLRRSEAGGRSTRYFLQDEANPAPG